MVMMVEVDHCFLTTSHPFWLYQDEQQLIYLINNPSLCTFPDMSLSLFGELTGRNKKTIINICIYP